MSKLGVSARKSGLDAKSFTTEVAKNLKQASLFGFKGGVKDIEEMVKKTKLLGTSLEKLGIKVVITTSETNEVVATRAKKMKIEALRGLLNKKDSISTYLEKASLSWEDAWYLGNDVNDLEPMQKVALSFCPLDASVEVFKIADVVLSRRGGEGVLAEIASRLESVNK
jgi:YrbI family 3-deoxy-D-manno-octulosonate 8-phosphate phosphatase